MLTEHTTLCINCLHKQPSLTPCAHCGYDEHYYKHHPLYLKPRTLLENQYILGKMLGQGGFGVTYFGLDKWLQKKVAIKEYLPATLATRDFQTADIIPLRKQEQAFNQGLQSFIREARNLARFNHPHIVKVLNFFKAHQTGYMVMEYLAGTSPATHLSVPDTLAIMLPILDALAEIHAQQIYHCDISIQNIRVTPEGTPILIDFGAVRQKVSEQSRSLAFVLKHGYAPIEQYSGQGNIGPWTDIYACGALFYLLLTGTLPPAATDRFNTDTLTAPLTIIEHIPPALNDAIMCALALEPAQRFQSVQAFKSALQGQSPITQLTTLPMLASATPRKKKRVKFTALSLFLLGSGFLLMSPDWTSPTMEPFPVQLVTIVENTAPIAKPLTINREPQPIVKKETVAQPITQKTDVDLQKIVQHYEQVARTAQTQGNLTLSLEMIRQGLKIAPTHAELLTLEKQLQTQVTQKKQITQLLEQAEHYLKNHQLEAAYQTYQTILQIDTQHVIANKGLQHIAENYVQQAQHKQLPDSLIVVNKGLTLFPQHPELQTLKAELTAVLARQQQIENLLKEAEKYRHALRLTEPPQANAYETYRKVLNLVPNHPDAQTGLNKIADQYAQLAQAESNNVQRQQLFIEKGLKISPTHNELLVLNTQFDLHKNAPKPPAPVQEVQPVQPTSAPIEILPVDTTQNLLTFAQQQLAEDKLEVAIQTYRDILAIDPQHPQAIQGLQQISARYEQLARHQQQQANIPASLTLVEKGLAVAPEHKGLTHLKEELTTQTAKKSVPKTSETVIAPIIFTPTF